jgi:ubiquinone/menaquinone biosynthesis C-methylase UbiE
MIKQAKNNVQFLDNVEIIQSSFTDIRLPRKMDVIFSNSALHWVQDYRKAFQNFWEMLKKTNDSNDIIIYGYHSRVLKIYAYTYDSCRLVLFVDHIHQ